MNFQDEYLQPDLHFFPSFEDAFNDDPTKQQMRRFLNLKQENIFKSLLSFKRNYVIAEPGYGKTRLLYEVVQRAKEFGKEAIIIDLKKLIEESFLAAVRNQAKDHSRRTENFELIDNENNVFCFDALDEIKADSFNQLVEKLKQFIIEHSSAIIIVACRRHFFKQKLRNLELGDDFRFARIFPFSEEKVVSYLSKNSFTEEQIQKTREFLAFQQRDLIIQTPRYLELFVTYFKENPDLDIKQITKTELFEYFINKKLEHEDLKLDTQNRDLAKRLLEIIALLMEIFQTNKLQKDELISIIGEVKSNFPTIFLNQVKIENLYNNSVLKADTETIEFDNTEFQEYLSAKEIVRLGENKRIAFDLFVDPILREIHPSWFNVLRFLLEMDGSLLKPLLDFGKSNGGKAVEDDEYHRLLVSVNVETLKAEDRKSIFEQIFVYYQEAQIWLPYDIAKKLAYCFDLSHHKLLKKYINSKRFKNNETKRYVNCGNVAEIVAFILERNIFNKSEKAFWKKKLIEFAKDKNKNGVLQRNALHGLAKLNDETVISEVESVWDAEDEHIKDQFLNICREVNPNSGISIKYFVEGTKQKSIYARYGLFEIKLKSGIKKLLQYFREDQEFLYMFADHESIYKDRDQSIVENIEAVWDSEIQRLLNRIIINTYTSGRLFWVKEAKFLLRIAILLKKKSDNYIFELISGLQDSFKDNWLEITRIFAELLNVEQIERFVAELEKLEDGRICALRTLRDVKYLTKREDAHAIYETGRQFFLEDYQDYEKRKSLQKQHPSEAEEPLYRDFQVFLDLRDDNYCLDVFGYYLQHKNSIGHLIQKHELERLQKLITEKVFENFDPGEQDLKITQRSQHGSTQYSTHLWINVFGNCILLANEFGINVKKYRRKILNYIPFAYSDHLNSIFALVKSISKDEIQNVISVYKEKKSDLWRFMPENLIRASEQYHIKEAARILREFVVNEKEFSSFFNRTYALKVAEILESDKNFLGNTFDRYKNETESILIATTANSLLIEKHEDESAIDWRFQELVKKAYPTKKWKRGEVYHGTDELRDKEFAAPVMKLQNPKHEERFLKLLQESFTIVSKKGYYDYAHYLWEIVCAYFDNRKQERSYLPLKKLEDFVAKHGNAEGVNWFNYELKKLKREYMLYVGKPRSIHECIKAYNVLKSQQYLDISTPRELLQTVVDIIDTNLRRWVESEGAYSFLVGEKIKDTAKQNYEDLIQKTILTQLENALLRRGFKDVDLIREPQLLDKKRVDFRVSYGFVGPIVIELKLSSKLMGTNLQEQKSYKSFIQYIEGNNAHFGIFLVFDDIERTPRTQNWDVHLRKIKTSYETFPRATVCGLEIKKLQT